MSEPVFDINWAAAAIGGRLEVNSQGVREFSKVVIDTREDVTGALFVAIKGPRFDGHDFVRQALDAGAAAVMVSNVDIGVGASRIIVEDTLTALQALSCANRNRFKGKVVGITGSNGKTTTRRILTSILKMSRLTHEPRKNFNNHIGVPLTLLELSDEMDAAVLELGCSDFGEISALTKLADPDVALITNVGPAHLEKLIDLDGVARAKGELFAGLRSNAVAVINLDDPRVANMTTPASEKITFGRCVDADVRLINRSVKKDGTQIVTIFLQGISIESKLPLPGAHNAQNAVAAAAAAIAAGASPDEIQRGLASTPQTTGRLATLKGPQGTTIIDDTYNANPVSTAAALGVLAELPKGAGRLAVLSDLLELGKSAAEAHRKTGRLAAASNLKILITMGEGGAWIREGAIEAGMNEKYCHHARSHEEASEVALKILKPGDTVLVKGSRGVKMEVVVKLLTEGVS